MLRVASNALIVPPWECAWLSLQDYQLDGGCCLQFECKGECQRQPTSQLRELGSCMAVNDLPWPALACMRAEGTAGCSEQLCLGSEQGHHLW